MSFGLLNYVIAENIIVIIKINELLTSIIRYLNI